MTIFRHLALAALFGLAACGSGVDTGSSNGASTFDPADNDPPQMCAPGAPDPRACDPANTKKTTVCHIPPGNPANFHTICVGNAAVRAHLAHGDVLGSCCDRPGVDAGNPPPPPPPHDGKDGGKPGDHKDAGDDEPPHADAGTGNGTDGGVVDPTPII